VTDLEVAADALTLDELSWLDKYGDRSRDDIYARDDKGKLIQEMVTSPPNAQLVSKLLSSLIPAYWNARPSSTITADRCGSKPDGTLSCHLRHAISSATPSALWHRLSNSADELACAPAPLRRYGGIQRPSIATRSCCGCDAVRDADGKLLPPLPSESWSAGVGSISRSQMPKFLLRPSAPKHFWTRAIRTIFYSNSRQAVEAEEAKTADRCRAPSGSEAGGHRDGEGKAVSFDGRSRRRHRLWAPKPGGRRVEL